MTANDFAKKLGSSLYAAEDRQSRTVLSGRIQYLDSNHKNIGTLMVGDAPDGGKRMRTYLWARPSETVDDCTRHITVFLLLIIMSGYNNQCQRHVGAR
jgi:hypothetical protein